MDTMKQMTLNASGVGDLATYRALRAVTAAADDTSTGHDIAVTSGEDGVVYFVDVHTERVLFDAIVCDGTMPAIAVVPEQTHLLVVSGDENELYSYTMPPHFARDALLLRSPVAIRHVACSASLIAVATEDTEIKVLRRAATDEIIAVQGHEHGIKSVTFDPSGHRLCSASEDGTVRVFAIDEAALRATQVAQFKIQYGDLRSDQVLARCAWQPGNRPELLAVPLNQGIVELVECTTWTSKGQLLLPIGKSKSSDINVLSFSPNGLYVAGATLAQQVFIWSVATKECVRSFKIEHHVVSVQWAPSQNVLLVFNDGGKLGVVHDAVPMGLTPPHQVGLGGGTTTTVSTSVAVSITEKKKPSTTTKRLTASQFVEDQAMDDGGDEGESDGDGDGGREAEFDEGETRVEAIKASFGFGAAATSGDADLGLVSDHHDDDEDDTVQYKHSKTGATFTASPFQTFQEPFQSGSVHDGAVTLLAWTPLGEIECVRGANRREQLVKVEFTDKSRRGFKFSDQYLFTMASLDTHGAFFAVPRRGREDWDDAGHDAEHGDVIRSFIFYRPFESWASNAAWHVDLPDGEDAESIACAQDFCAVATSLQCLRIFTTSGIAFATIRLPGRIVTLAAHGTKLAVVYQDGVARLAFQLLEVCIGAYADRVRVVAHGRVPLTPPLVDVFASHKENEGVRCDVSQYATLQWLGFDDRGILLSVDSVGCVQALASSYAYQWFPVGCIGNALLQKPEDRAAVFTLGVVHNALLYFPVERGMTAPKLRGKHRPVPLKFMLQHAAFPTTKTVTSTKKSDGHGPVVNDLWQHIRLAAIDGDDRQSVDKRVAEQAEMDKSLILMMKAACTNDEPLRVLDLAKCLHLEKSHQIAQKLAGHFDFRQLQTQLYALYRDRFERDENRHDRPLSQRRAVGQRAVTQAPTEPASRPQPRLGRQPKPVETAPPSDEQDQDQEEAGTAEVEVEAEVSTSTLSSPRAKRELLSSNAKPVVERSVAPVNPFLKKPTGTHTAAGSAKPKTSGGLERLADFTSPPPAKRSKPWK